MVEVTWATITVLSAMKPTSSQATLSGSCFAWGKKRCIDEPQAGGLSRERWAASEQASRRE